MAHIGQAINDSHLFWYNDKVGELILTEVWKNLHSSYMDNNQLYIVPSEEAKAITLFKSFGYTISFS